MIFISFILQGPPAKQPQQLGEVGPDSRYKSFAYDELRLRSIVVAGLVLCTTSGALCTERLNGMSLYSLSITSVFAISTNNW